jgi:tetratricopeptide (TPR) repeat protein
VAPPEQETLDQRLARFPAERYPVQHATTQFHLGSQLLHAGDVAAALDALTVARDLFARSSMPLEAAKATVMLGVGLRSSGRLADAAAAFTAAAQVLGNLEQPVEQAAAAYNLGLVRQDSGDVTGAHEAWAQARALFLGAGYPAQAGAAARDHGASLLTAGQVDDARPLLEQARALAERAGDGPGAGAAGNVLGLAHLAAHDAPAAVAALRDALGWFARAVRPADHAMVKANLALAHEQAGDLARARLAARQALALRGAAAPVRAQAQQVLHRSAGQPHEDLLAALDSEDRAQWVAVLREEVLRVAGRSGQEQVDLVRGFLDGVLVRPDAAYALAESLLHVVLELPPPTYDALVAAIVRAVAGRSQDDGERLHGVFASAMARFPIPQWQRLAAGLNAAAQAVGEPATWR